MNACILAGGIGSRLQPLTCTRPKPMVPLFDRPMLAYTLEMLKKAGVKRCFITLMYLPDSIPSYFGDHYSDMELIYHVEEKSMGSAGGILAFGEALKDEPFLVVSGDAVFDFDLSLTFDEHKRSGNKATLVVTEAKDPTPFGMVQVAPSGKVTAFREKPSWEQASGGLVNTGIYVFSPDILGQIPSDRPFDFSRDLFPILLQEGSLGSHSLKGYWRDIGTPEAYLSCMHDGLDGVWKPPLPLRTVKPPKGVEIIHPVYLSPRAHLANGVRIGPYAVVGSHAVIGQNTTIAHAYVDGKVEENVSLSGAIVDKGCRVGRNSILLGGSILGEGALLGQGSLVENNVHVWCHAVVEQGSHLFPGTDSFGLVFRHKVHVHQGHIHRVTPSDAMDLAFSMHEAGIHEVTVGSAKNDSIAGVLANSFTSGFLSSGGKVICHDGSQAAAAAWIGTQLRTNFSLWFEGNDLLIFNSHGRLVDGEEFRFPLESFVQNEDIVPYSPRFLLGIDLLYQKHFSHSNLTSLSVATSDSRLSPLLTESGVHIFSQKAGHPYISLDLYGIHLVLSDEKGYAFTPDEVTLLLILCELLSGNRKIRIPDDAPLAAESLASEYGAAVERILSSRDPLPDWYCYGAAAATLLLKTMQETGRSLSSLASSTPSCFTVTKSFRSPNGRIAALNHFEHIVRDHPHVSGNGIRVTIHGSTIGLHASALEDFMVLKTESHTEETASELCDFYYQLLTQSSEKSVLDDLSQDLS